MSVLMIINSGWHIMALRFRGTCNQASGCIFPASQLAWSSLRLSPVNKVCALWSTGDVPLDIWCLHYGKTTAVFTRQATPT